MRSTVRTGLERKPGGGGPFAMVIAMRSDVDIKGDLGKLDGPGPMRFDFDRPARTSAIPR
ncbi:hypothetical protein AB6Q13_04285 [Ralstonia solanacearum]|uniref:Uncharacterized protein n=1 Tax=Ralstonia solanacearum TaxID=305 RepID=A0AAW5ZRU3_RALSL|nr:hypothetical protein [Ralstonia solanacearum]MDB0511930.1 hypothetical protein [Ralstonia solanacearum]MDB0567365.1 hypothetical protein [Ralstonia solanacearum]MDB0573205.1 hypothetical protein [Ralstonia solanacearum]MDB0577618.1 hypothetical protein [Ralstonia solanacearum]